MSKAPKDKKPDLHGKSVSMKYPLPPKIPPGGGGSLAEGPALPRIMSPIATPCFSNPAQGNAFLSYHLCILEFSIRTTRRVLDRFYKGKDPRWRPAKPGREARSYSPNPLDIMERAYIHHLPKWDDVVRFYRGLDVLDEIDFPKEMPPAPKNQVLAKDDTGDPTGRYTGGGVRTPEGFQAFVQEYRRIYPEDEWQEFSALTKLRLTIFHTALDRIPIPLHDFIKTSSSFACHFMMECVQMGLRDEMDCDTRYWEILDEKCNVMRGFFMCADMEPWMERIVNVNCSPGGPTGISIGIGRGVQIGLPDGPMMPRPQGGPGGGKGRKGPPRKHTPSSSGLRDPRDEFEPAANVLVKIPIVRGYTSEMCDICHYRLAPMYPVLRSPRPDYFCFKCHDAITLRKRMREELGLPEECEGCGSESCGHGASSSSSPSPRGGEGEDPHHVGNASRQYPMIPASMFQPQGPPTLLTRESLLASLPDPSSLDLPKSVQTTDGKTISIDEWHRGFSANLQSALRGISPGGGKEGKRMGVLRDARTELAGKVSEAESEVRRVEDKMEAARERVHHISREIHPTKFPDGAVQDVRRVRFIRDSADGTWKEADPDAPLTPEEEAGRVHLHRGEDGEWERMDAGAKLIGDDSAPVALGLSSEDLKDILPSEDGATDEDMASAVQSLLSKMGLGDTPHLMFKKEGDGFVPVGAHPFPQASQATPESIESIMQKVHGKDKLGQIQWKRATRENILQDLALPPGSFPVL